MEKTYQYERLTTMIRKLLLIVSAFILTSSAPAETTPTCNRPLSDMPLRPDGCLGNEFSVEMPPEPIPPPCIAAWRIEDEIGGDPAVGLQITVEHPELNDATKPKGWVQIALYDGHDQWQLVAIDAQASCGKDEAPLAWFALEVLNRGNVPAAFKAYSEPPPVDFITTLTDLGQWEKSFLPIVTKQK